MRKTRTSFINSQPSQERDAYWLYALAPSSRERSKVNIEDESAAATGKWMVFVYADELDASWAIIKAATEKGTLGPSSKTSTGRDNPNSTSAGVKVIIVYTHDANDCSDVGRILKELRRLGFVGRLNYKSDADTFSGTYGAGASLYTSAEKSLEFYTPKARRK
jgi:hypothetical protein